MSVDTERLDIDQDIDFEDEIEREREDTPLSEVEETIIQNKENEPKELPHDKLSQITSYNKSTRVLSAAEQTLKSQILLLCSALGGSDVGSDTKEYTLGVDALACLKDLKRWLKAVDEATHTWHVAAACHDSALIINDLVPIMIQTPSKINDTNKAYMQSIVLSTLELLVSLTKPLVLDVENASASQMDIYMRLKKDYVKCKHHIINYENGKCLKAVVGVALPILAQPKDSRSNRDNVILNLCMHFFRNMIRIEPADFTISKKRSSTKTQQILDNMPPGVTKQDISFDNLMTKFKKNKVLMFIQTITAGLGTEFDSEILAPVCLDIYFHLVHGVDPEVLFQDAATAPHQTAVGSKLAELIGEEKEIKKQLFSNNITRHANFGTLLSIKENSKDTALTVGTQRGMIHSDPLEELDSGVSKKQVATRVHRDDKESTHSDFDTRLGSGSKVIAGPRSRAILKKFCTDFTEAGFGVLCTQIRRITSSNGLGAFADYNYLYLIQWILQFERLVRQDTKKDAFKRFGYVVVCLEDQMIRLLMVSRLPTYYGTKEFTLLRVAVAAFKQILLTAMDIHKLDSTDKSKLTPDDAEELDAYVSISEAALRNIFASEDAIDVLFRVPQDASKFSLAYACSMMDFVNVLFKTLHYLSNLSVPIVLGKKMRQARKRFETEDHIPGDESEDEYDTTDPAKLKQFHVLDKQRYGALEERLLHEHIVDTYVSCFSRFNDLTERQAHECLSYFNRLLRKWEVHFLKLVRLDFMLALHDFKHAHFSSKLMDEAAKTLSFYMRVLQKLHKHSESILMEALTRHQTQDTDLQLYLLGGSLDEVKERQGQIRATDLKFNDENMSFSYKVSVLVSQLYYGDKSDLVEELISLITDYKDQRLSWETKDLAEDDAQNTTVPPEKLHLTNKLVKEQRKDAVFRLLVETIGFESNMLPETITTEQISQRIGLMQTALDNPLDSYEIEGKIITDGPDIPQEFRETTIIQRVGLTEEQANNLEKSNYRRTHHGYGEFAVDDDDVEDLAGEDDLDVIEARLEANESRVKGVAVKKKKARARKRRRKQIDSEDDDPIRVKRKSKKKKRAKKYDALPMHEGVEKAQKEATPEKPHLSSKFVQSDDDASDSEEERRFFEREEKLRHLVEKNGDKPITPEQFNALFHLGQESDNDDEDDMMRHDTPDVESDPGLSAHVEPPQHSVEPSQPSVEPSQHSASQHSEPSLGSDNSSDDASDASDASDAPEALKTTHHRAMVIDSDED